MISNATLTRLEETYRDTPCKFTKGLMRVLFSNEEMMNRTLFGRQANSHKDHKTKAALDQMRVSAMLGMSLFSITKNMR